MFLITNREIIDGPGPVKLGDKPNPSGPEELRAVEVTGSGTALTYKVVPDSVPASQFPTDSKITPEIDALNLLNADGEYPGSAYVAFHVLKAFKSRPKSKRHLLLYVHGYNTPVDSVVRTARDLEENYDVVCLPFTWPSNGGGTNIWNDARGLASYLSDKQDARNSVNALDRFISRLFDYIDRLFAQSRLTVEREALERFPDDLEARRRYLSKALPEVCPVVVSILFHSMGNYLFEYVMKSESNRSSQLLVFENVIMAAADVNNWEHAQWVDRIPFRRNLYVTLNEDDFALRASRAKFGQEQKPRLGHFRHALIALNVKYVDFTGAAEVGNAHSYFLDEPIANPKVRKFFEAAFTGRRGEEVAALRYDTAENVYRVK